MENKYGYILNTKISALSFQETLCLIENWISEKKSKYICVCNTHSLVTGSNDRHFKNVLDNASLCIPDGMPLVWGLKMMDFKSQDRVDGPNLMLKLCELSSIKEYRIFLYGSTQETLEKLEKELKIKYKNIKIVGKISPPFKKQTEEEVLQDIKAINSVKPDLVFVSLGCPKQEIWMNTNKNKVNGIMIGVGAAFNFITGDIKRPPVFFQKLGLEWFFRLLSEPKRLFKRYAVNNSQFIFKFILTYKDNKRKTLSKIC